MRFRLLPALSLFVLTPLIAEYLLGSLPMSMIAILPLMAALYGSGALLIRETVRRAGKGWPSLILLAVAYGLIEEGFVTQSLFNPNYLHLRLLDSGFIPALGTALPWLIFVVSIHVIWSISVPVGLTETLFRDKRNEPWLGWVSGTVFVLLFFAGAALIAVFSYKQVPFMATPMQFTVTGIAVIALIAAALMWPNPKPAEPGRKAPHPLVLFAASFGAGSALMAVQHTGPEKLHLPWQALLAGVVVLEVLFVLFMVVFTRGRGWTAMQRFALMIGGLAVYGWSGFQTDIELHGTKDLPAHTVIAVVFVIIAALALWRASRPERLKETR